jgi:hypothetical protein
MNELPHMMTSWPFIDTAPRDGTVIEGQDHAGNRFPCAYRKGGWRITYPQGSLGSGLMFDLPVNPVRWSWIAGAGSPPPHTYTETR